MLHSKNECKEMVDEICERGADRLTEWESNFIDSLYGHEDFTNKQKEIIDRIYTQRVRQHEGF